MDPKRQAYAKLALVGACFLAFLAVLAAAQFGKGLIALLPGPGLSGEAAYAARPPTASVPARPVLKILFLGNSYTFYNHMPDMLPWIAASDAGGTFDIRVETYAVGGGKLIEYAAQPDVLNRLLKGGYSAVILQDQSQAAMIPGDAANSMVALRGLTAAASGGGAVPFLYGTWPRRKGDPTYAQTPEAQGSPDLMAGIIDRHYRAAAREMGAGYAPVGLYWRRAELSDPALGLYLEDGSHPNAAGSYLAALVLYRTVARRDPRAVSWTPGSVPAPVAAFLRRVAAGS